jgi:predicted dehydrogenase
MTRINVAVVGFGMSATVFHIPFLESRSLSSRFNLHTIVERSSTPTSSKARDQFPHVKVVNTLDQALRDPEIDAVWVLTINDTHYDYVKQSLKHKKHVVVEKPITPTSQQALELCQLAKDENLVLAVYQNRRWDGDFLTIKRMIESKEGGTFGELTEFQSNFDRFRNEPAVTKVWKEKNLPGSGLCYDLGSHLIDQLLSLFGKPQSVTGFLQNSRLIGNLDVPDTFRILLHYSPDESREGRSLPLTCIAQSSSLSLVSPQQRFLVKGTKASYLKHGLDPQEDSLKKFGKDAVEREDFGVEEKGQSGKLWTKDGDETIESEKGSYKSWFENVADVSSLSLSFSLHCIPIDDERDSVTIGDRVER